MKWKGVAAQFKHDVDEFLEELNNNIDGEDYLCKLDAANNPMNTVNANGIVEWNPDNVRRIVYLELEKYKAAHGTSMKNSITGKFSCPLEW
jgi:hypothetical protein